LTSVFPKLLKNVRSKNLIFDSQIFNLYKG